MRVWVPIGVNLGLVGVAAGIERDGVATALTSAAAVVTTVAIVVHARAAAADQERIAYLQAALPRLTSAVDAEGVLSLAPKPSPVMGEVLRQQKPALAKGPTTPLPFVAPERIDPT